MKSKVLLFTFFLGLISTSCNPKEKEKSENNPNFSKVPFTELVELLKNNQIDLFKITYKDSLGNELSDSLRKKLNQGKLYREFYRNTNEEITQIRVKHLYEKDFFKEIQTRELLSNPFQKINKIEIDCELSDSLLLDAFKKDQDIRKGIDVGIVDVDGLNQDLVVSIIDQCGWPKTEELIESIWFVIQHADSGLMAYYYPKFKELVNNGLLKQSTMALMEDRMLMNNGFPQIYGSQIVKNNVYKFRDPKNINQRRKEIGLPPMEEYTKIFGFEFNIQDYLDD